MSVMNQREYVKHQYSSDNNLSARIKLHEKHSTNKKGFYPWLFELYRFEKNDSILDLGCGNAMQWKGRTSGLPAGSSLTLSDYSEGMLNAAKENLALECGNISFFQVDIQRIPFASQSFNTVIANHMLYHVPDLDKALSEAHRVLKTGGWFYASTVSGGGIRQFLHDTMVKLELDADAFAQGLSFTMQNGGDILSRYFPSVKRYDYIDSLAITETHDLMDWLKSSMSASDNIKEKSDTIYEYFEKIRIAEGAINIPKEACLFVCTAG